MKSISKEDYLSVIYKHKDDNHEIKANVIAGMMNISNAAVTDMLKKMSREGLIIYSPYKGIKLSHKGEQYARKMVRRHRIWEVFLHKVVGIPWEKVHEEAHNLEHSSSDYLIDKMEEMMDYPMFDPHGDPIPSKNGAMPKVKKHVALSKVIAGTNCEVVRVNDYHEEFLNYMGEIGLKVNQRLKVEEVRQFDNSLKIKLNKKRFDISGKIAENVFVEELKD